MKYSLLALTLAAATLAADDADPLVCVPCKPVEPAYISLWHHGGKGVGFDKGYSSVDLFLPQYKNDGVAIPFLDLRGHVFNDGKFAGNLGIGFRFCATRVQAYVGPSVYYDLRRFKKKTYHQAGFALEYIRPKWSATINGYVPLGRKSALNSVSFKEFLGNNAILKEKYRRSMTGVDFRLTVNALDCFWGLIDVTAAPYAYWPSDGKNAIGGFARLRARVLDTIIVGVETSYDSFFKWRGLGEIGVSFGFGGKKTSMRRSQAEAKGCCCVDPLARRASWQPDRHEIVVLSEQNDTSVMKDPQGNPYFFIHVNNLTDLSGPAGLGTFGSPYSTLLQAEMGSNPGNIIYVQPGNGTAAGMSDGITLQNLQQFLGSGLDYAFPISKDVTITVPALTPGNTPQITNTNVGGAGVTLAGANTVSGFDIVGPSGAGVSATAVTVGSTVDRVSITNAGGSGVLVSLEEGTSVRGLMQISNSFITGAGANGIQIDNGAGGTGDTRLEFAILNNQSVTNTGDGIDFVRAASTGDFALIGTIDGNQLNNNTLDGISFVYPSAAPNDLQITFSNNVVRENGDMGANFELANGTLNLLNNDFSLNGDEGILVELDNVGALFTTLGCRCIGNTAFGNTDTNAFFFDLNDNDNVLNLEFSDNFVGPSPSHFQFDLTGGSTVNVRMGPNQGNMQISGSQAGFILVK